MKWHFLQHVPFEGPAHIHTLAHERKIQLSRTALYKGEVPAQPEEFDLLFVMGGPMSVNDTGRYPWLNQEKAFVGKCIEAGKKIIGICLGAQIIAEVLGAQVKENKYTEIGWFPVRSLPPREKKIARTLPEQFMAFHWHGDTFDIPRSALHLAESDACTNQAFLYDEKILGLQFHLECTENSIRDLLLNCSDELDRSEYVQAPGEILSPVHVDACNSLMAEVINALMQS